MGGRNFKYIAIDAVKPLGNIPADLHVLLLVLAHRDKIGLVKEDISRHKGRVGEQTGVDIVLVLGGFVLELSHTAELAEHGVAVQHPAQLGVGRDVGLDKNGALLRVQTAGNIVGQQCEHPAAQLGRLLADCDGVQIGQEKVAVKFLNHLGPVAQRPQVVAQVKLPAGLDAGEHYFFFVHVIGSFIPERFGSAYIISVYCITNRGGKQ